MLGVGVDDEPDEKQAGRDLHHGCGQGGADKTCAGSASLAM